MTEDTQVTAASAPRSASVGYFSSRKARRAGNQAALTAHRIEQFHALPPDRQFEELVRLRMSAAHLSGGSFGAFLGAYLAVILGFIALISSGPFGLNESWVTWTILGIVTLGGGLWIAVQYAREQYDLATDVVVLQFCEESATPNRYGTVESARTR